MISPKFAKTILNEIFHTGGSGATMTSEEEKASLISSGVQWGVTADEYFNAFKQDGFKVTGETTNELNGHKSKIRQSEWWANSTKNTESKPFKYVSPLTEKETEISLSGWEVGEPSLKPDVSYPSTVYLALFTKMPDRYGVGYQEPQYATDGSETNYMRVNLHVGIITGDKSLNYAFKDEETGASVINNKEIIAYPEVEGDYGWGEILGFGIFDKKEVMSGTPIFWGALSNDGGKINAIKEHVPLFRVGNFKITLH